MYKQLQNTAKWFLVMLWIALLVMVFSGLPPNSRASAAVTGLRGDGTSKSPYLIYTPGQLEYTAKGVNAGRGQSAHYKLMADLDFTGFDYALDQKGNATGWTPIGTNHSFSGIFDGNGHVIIGLTIDRTEPKQGLFGTISSGAVKNLELQNVHFNAGSFVGGIAGSIDGYSRIINCRVSGKISGISNVGGIVGRGNYADHTKILRCSNLAQIRGQSLSTGGIAGEIWGETLIEACYNTGDIYSSGYHTGGIAGSLHRTVVRNCYSTGRVEGYARVGGLVGTTRDGTIIDYCYCTGEVRGVIIAGGIVGDLSTYVSDAYGIGFSAALNPEVGTSEGDEVGRIFAPEQMSDDIGVGSNNYALSSMKVAGQSGNANVMANAAGLHGKDVTPKETAAKAFWVDTLGFSEDVWMFQENKLPILRSNIDAFFMPKHLAQ